MEDGEDDLHRAALLQKFFINDLLGRYAVLGLSFYDGVRTTLVGGCSFLRVERRYGNLAANKVEQMRECLLGAANHFAVNIISSLALDKVNRQCFPVCSERLSGRIAQQKFFPAGKSRF